jgi:hypothetical protein
MKRDMHIGGERPLHIRAVAKETFVVEAEKVEEVFNPEALKTDGNPFPEELQEEVTEEVVEETPLNYESMTVEELKALLRARSLDVKGKKAVLITRLIEADTPSLEAVEADEVVPSQEAATSDEGVSETDAKDSRPDVVVGEQPSD